jgi:hypothetical protein
MAILDYIGEISLNIYKGKHLFKYLAKDLKPPLSTFKEIPS